MIRAQPLPELPVIFVMNLVFIGIGEEAGWTAFAAPLLLLHRHSLLRAWAILAALRILWHLPLMLTGDSGWIMGIVGNAAFQMILLQLFYLSGGRWSLAAVWHASLNTFGGSFFTAMVIGADQVRLACSFRPATHCWQSSPQVWAIVAAENSGARSRAQRSSAPVLTTP